MWQSVLDALAAHVAVVSDSGRIVAVNGAWRRFAESNHARISAVCEGADYFAVCETARGPDAVQAARFPAEVRAVMHGERDRFVVEYPCHSPREPRWFVADVTRTVLDGAVMAVVAHIDITARHLAQAALQESEARLRSLFATSLDAIFLAVHDGRILAANPAACRMFDRSECELTRVGWTDLVDSADPRLARGLAERDRTGQLRGELTFVRRDGSRFVGEVSSAVFAGPHGAPRTSLVVRDVSARRRDEDELRTSREQLRARGGRERRMRILVADDHALLRRGLIQILGESYPDAEFGEASTTPEAIAQLGRDRWDVLVLDVVMPGRSGLDVLREARRQWADLPVLVLSSAPEDQLAVRVLKAGARGYLNKRAAPEEVVAAVQALAEGKRYISASLAERLAADVCEPAGPLHERLSGREFEILQGLLAGHSIKAIADSLSLSPKTVSSFHVRIWQKLGVQSDIGLIRYAVEHGLAGSGEGTWVPPGVPLRARMEP